MLSSFRLFSEFVGNRSNNVVQMMMMTILSLVMATNSITACTCRMEPMYAMTAIAGDFAIGERLRMQYEIPVAIPSLIISSVQHMHRDAKCIAPGW